MKFVGYALAMPKKPKTKTPRLGQWLQFEDTQKLGMGIAVTYVTALATRITMHIVVLSS